MKAQVRWVENAHYQATSGSGHTLGIDGPPEIGGQNLGMRPMELMLLGLGGCSSVDVIHILKKSRLSVDGCECDVSAERAETPPKVFTRIHLHFRVSGENLQEKQVARAVKLSAEKYCSASIMLARGGVEVTHSHAIVPTPA